MKDMLFALSVLLLYLSVAPFSYVKAGVPDPFTSAKFLVQ
jgi:hypothetical protein